MFIHHQSIDTNGLIRDREPCCAPSSMAARAVDAPIVVAAPEPVLVLFLGKGEGSAESAVYNG